MSDNNNYISAFATDFQNALHAKGDLLEEMVAFEHAIIDWVNGIMPFVELPKYYQEAVKSILAENCKEHLIPNSEINA